MKKLICLRSLSIAIIFTLLASAAEAVEYYVVIGTFKDESSARKFTSDVRNYFKDVSYSFNDIRGVYYVHVLKTSRKEEAQNWSLYLKHEKGFKDAWVLTDPVNEGKTYSPGVNSATNRQLHDEGEDQVPGQRPVIASASGTGRFLSYETTEAASSELNWTDKWGVSYISDLKNPKRLMGEHAPAADNIFTFVVEDAEGREIPSEVMLVDFAKARRIASFATGEHAAILGSRREQMVTFVCDVIGYAQETRMYNIEYLNRGRDIKKNEDGIWEVRIKLKEMELNDVAFLNRTVFYDDAAVLQPSSEEELKELLAIMKSSPGYEIVLHGHCNPKGKREIRLPENVNGYFDLNSSETKTASDKRLSKERARTVKNYLVAHGIDKKRIGIIGWGSLHPLVKSTSRDAEMNDRVEFELVAREIGRK